MNDCHFPWFEETISQLSLAYANHRFPHGLLISAPDGSGKKSFSLRVARFLLCKSPQIERFEACGDCKSCALIDSESHPDLYWIKQLEDKKGNLKGSIGIDQIRALTDKLSETAQMAGWRIAVIESVNRMTVASYNALLKTLEEPGNQTLLMLLVDQLHMVPATIRSRCQIVTFDLHKQHISDWLMKSNPDYQSAQVDRAIYESASAPLKAKALLDSDYFAKRDEFNQQMDNVFLNHYSPQRLIESFATDSKESWSLLANYFIDKVKMATANGCVTLSSTARGIDCPSIVLFEHFDKILDYQKVQASGGNLQAKLQFQSIISQWYEAGRRITANSVR